MKQITLYSDGKAKNDRFGITDQAGNPVWYGLFFANDYVYNGEQSTSEMSAAQKAVYFASYVAKQLNTPIHLNLKVDAEWLLWANSSDPKRGGKAKALKKSAEKLGVSLKVSHVDGVDNPADKYTICKGYQKYQDYDLNLLEITDYHPASEASENVE